MFTAASLISKKKKKWGREAATVAVISPSKVRIWNDSWTEHPTHITGKARQPYGKLLFT